MIEIKIFKPTNKLTLAMLLAAGVLTLALQGCNEEVPVTDMGAGTVAMPLEDQEKEIRDPAIAGGRLYDHWIDAILPIVAPTLIENKLMRFAYDPDLFGVGAATKEAYRCKNCHGWDYKGADGKYDLSNEKYTGFPGVLGAAEYSIEELIEFLTNGKEYPIPDLPLATSTTTTTSREHDFGRLLPGPDGEKQIKQLAYFVKYGTLDTNPYIGRFTGTGLGDGKKGEALYASKEAGCAGAGCHGPNGTLINFGTTPPKYVGTLGNENPWEMLHKIRFGQPDSDMPSIYNAGLSTQDAVDIMTHTQTLEK